MSKGYRHYAARCLALAQVAEDACARAHLVQMADLWREMVQKPDAKIYVAQDEPGSQKPNTRKEQNS
jgi:hypothetical protein